MPRRAMALPRATEPFGRSTDAERLSLRTGGAHDRDGFVPVVVRSLFLCAGVGTILIAAIGSLRGNFISNYQTNNRLRGLGGNLGANHGGFNWNMSASWKAAADYENKFDGRVYNSKFNERNLGGYAGYNGNWGYTHFIAGYFKQNLGVVEGEGDGQGRFIKPLPGGLEGLPPKDDLNSI